MLHPLLIKPSRRDKVTFFSALLFGLLAHGFALTNLLFNHDVAGFSASYGVGLPSGRWALELIGNGFQALYGGYNLPFLNGIIAIVFVALAACLVSALFRFRHTYAWIFTGGLMVSFPAVVSAMFYRFTTAYYMLALLFMVAAVYVTRRWRFGLVLGSFLGAFALGIYQAYLPMMATLFVALLIQDAFCPHTTWQQVLVRSFQYLLTLILSYVLYRVILQLALMITGTQLSAYQNISQMGCFTPGQLLAAVKRAYRCLLWLPYTDYCQVAPFVVIRKGIKLLGLLSGALILGLLVKTPSWLKRVEAVVLCLLFPIALNSIEIIGYGAFIYTLMVCSVVCLYFLPMILLDLFEEVFATQDGRLSLLLRLRNWSQTGLVCLLSLILAGYLFGAEINYVLMQRSQQQTQAYFNTLVAQVKLTPGYDPDLEWAFIGDRFQDKALITEDLPLDLLYGGNHMGVNLMAKEAFLSGYLRHRIGWASSEKTAQLAQNPTVQQMPNYPLYGSIQIVEDTVVVKLEDPTAN